MIGNAVALPYEYNEKLVKSQPFTPTRPAARSENAIPPFTAIFGEKTKMLDSLRKVTVTFGKSTFAKRVTFFQTGNW